MITENFRAAVKKNDLLGVHIMMKDSLFTDPSFQTFREMENEACGMENLYVPHDGIAFLLDEAAWTQDYMSTLLADVVNNFSRERIEHLKKVIQKLHPMQAGRKVVVEQSIGVDRGKKFRPKRHRAPGEYLVLPLQLIVKGVAVGGLLLGLIIILIKSIGIFSGVLAGALVGGSFAYVIHMKWRQI